MLVLDDGDIPLGIVLKRLREQPVEDRFMAAESFERKFPDRIDFWLYRRIIFDEIRVGMDTHGGRRSYRDGTSFTDVATRLWEGLERGEENIRSSCGAIAARIDFRLSRDMARDRQANNCLIDIAKALDDPGTFSNINVGPLERALLALMGASAAICLRDALNRVHHGTNFGCNFDDFLGRCVALKDKITAIDEEIRSPNPRYSIFDRPIDAVEALQDTIRAERRHAGGHCIPWAAPSYVNELALALDNHARDRKSVNAYGLIPERYNEVRAVLELTRDFQQAAWLIVHHLRRSIDRARHDGYHLGANVSPIELASREQQLLAELAFLESQLGNHIRAGLYATIVLQLLRKEPEQLYERQARRLEQIAKELGLVYQPYKEYREIESSETERGKRRAERGHIFLYEWVLGHKPDINGIARELYPCGLPSKPRKWGQFLQWAAHNHQNFEEQQRTALFQLALKIGMLRTAGKIAYPGKGLTLTVDKDTLFWYAMAISSVYQKALCCIHYDTHHHKFRKVLRKLWKTTDARFWLNETLFLHEVQRGLFHPAVLRSAVDEMILWRLHNDPRPHELDAFHDHIAKLIPRGLADPLKPSDIKINNIRIPHDTVFVSMAIRDGHELSVVLVASDRSGAGNICDSFEIETCEPIGVGQPEEWAHLAKDIANTNEIWAQVDGFNGRRGWVPWQESFIKLGKELLRRLTKISNNTKCLALATNDVLRGLPWQHLFSVVLQKQLLVEQVIGASQFIPKLQAKRDNSTIVRQKRKELSDPNDPVYDKIRDTIEKNRVSWDDEQTPALLTSVLTAFAHGQRNGVLARIILGGKPLTKNDLAELTGYALAVIHSCHTGYIEHNPLGDLGGLPGFFLSHGSQLVVAPVAPVHPSAAEVFDLYFTAWNKDRNKDFRQMYLDAISEREDICYYSVYGDYHAIEEMKCCGKPVGISDKPRRKSRNSFGYRA